MYDYFLPPGLKNFFDSIFEPPIQFLTMARDYLDRISLAAGHGINLNNYFGFFAYLPGPFQAVINSLIAAVFILGVLQIIKVILRLYFAVKAGLFQWI